jgi:hypothetical protein
VGVGRCQETPSWASWSECQLKRRRARNVKISGPEWACVSCNDRPKPEWDKRQQVRSAWGYSSGLPSYYLNIHRRVPVLLLCFRPPPPCRLTGSTEEYLIKGAVGNKLVDENLSRCSRQTPTRLTRFLCWSLATRASSFFSSPIPCADHLDSLFTAISLPSGRVPYASQTNNNASLVVDNDKFNGIYIYKQA